MKTSLVCFAFVLLFFMTSCSSSKTTPALIREIAQKLESKNFSVEMNYAEPLRGRQVYLNSGYDLSVRNDSAFAYLPYYGVAYVAPYNSNEGGIKFAELMSGYRIVRNKKSTGWDITFKVKSPSYSYDIAMNVYDNGSVQLSFYSYERDLIRFSGELKR